MSDPNLAFLSPHSALERSMGIEVGGGDPMDFEPHGLPDDDPDATPPGRQAVSYGGGDGLFSPEEPQAQQQRQQQQQREEAAAAEPDGGGLDALTAGLLGVLGDPTSALGGGNSAALLAQLEAMADAFEQESGEVETDIRGKIAMLRGVLDARPSVIASQRARMQSAVDALDTDYADGAQPQPSAAAAAMRGEAALHSVAAAAADSLEVDLGRVDSMLRADPAAAAMVGSIMSGAVQKQQP